MKQLIQFLIKKREIKLTLKQIYLQKELNYNLQKCIELQREFNLLQEQKTKISKDAEV